MRVLRITTTAAETLAPVCSSPVRALARSRTMAPPRGSECHCAPPRWRDAAPPRAAPRARVPQGGYTAWQHPPHSSWGPASFPQPASAQPAQRRHARSRFSNSVSTIWLLREVVGHAHPHPRLWMCGGTVPPSLHGKPHAHDVAPLLRPPCARDGTLRSAEASLTLLGSWRGKRRARAFTGRGAPKTPTEVVGGA